MMERLKKFFAPPVFEDEEKTRQAYMLNLITWIFIGLTSLVVVGLIAANRETVDWGNLALQFTYRVIPFFVANIIAQVFMRTGRVKLASVLFITILWITYTISMLLSGGVYASEFTSFYILILLFSSLLLNARVSVIFLVLSIVAGGVAFVLYIQGVLPPLSLETSTISAQWLTISIAFSIATLVLYLFSREISRAQSGLQTANQELEEAQKALEVQVNIKTRGLELAAEVGQDLAQERDLDVLLAQAVDRIQAQFDLYYVQIYLADAGQRRLVLRAGTGEIGDALVQRGHRLAFGAGSINGASAATREPIVVADTATNPLFRPNALLPDTRSEMAIPLVAAGHIVGILNVQSNQAYGLTTDDFTTYKVLAGQLAIAIENANLFREINAAQLAAAQDAQRSTRDNWEAYLDAIERHEQFGYTFDGIDLKEKVVEAGREIEAKDGQLIIPIVINNELIGSIAVEADGLEDMSKVMVNAVAQQIARQAENLRLFSEAEKYRDEAEDAIQRLTRENWEVYESRISTFGYEYDQDMVHPLGQFDEAEDEAVSLTRDIKIHGESIGSLEVCDLDPDSGQAEALMDTVSSVLSAHIENLRLSEQTELALADSQKRGADLDLINRVVSIATESLDMEYTLQSIADELGTALGYDRVSISLIDVPRNSFTIMAEYVSGMVEKKTRGMTFSLDGDAFIPEVMRTKNPLTTANIKNTPSTSPAFEMVRAMNMDMFAMFPMIVGQDVVGTVSVASKETGRVLTDDEIVLLQTMIRQIATAVQNARLFTQTEQRARRDQILNEITARVYTAVDADSILQTAAKEIHRQLGFEAFVYLDDSAELEAQPDNGNNGQA